MTTFCNTSEKPCDRVRASALLNFEAPPRFYSQAGVVLILLFFASTPAYSQNAFDFGSGSAHVTFGQASELGLATFTIEAWFKREGTGTTASTGKLTAIPLVTKGRGQADGDTRDMNYFLGIRDSDNVLAADFEEGTGGPKPGRNHPIAGATPIITGVWYHAAATYDGSKWQLFLNGNLEAELVANQPPQSASIQHAGLGTALNSSGRAAGHFDGVLDEVRIWDYARSQAEVQASMNAQITSAQAGLRARWGLDEGTGTTINGSAGTVVNGTVRGTGWSWVAGAPFGSTPVNNPPGQPVVVAPADGATGVTTSPTLEVRVSDPDGDALTVTFYGRAVGAASFTTLGTKTGVASGTNTNVVWLGLATATEYEWYVSLSDGTETITGPTWRFTTGTVATIPTAPSNLAAASSAPTAVSLTWSDNSSDEDHFKLERSTTGASGTFSLRATLAADVTSHTDSGLSGGTEYCYRVRATNTAGASAYSNVDCATTPLENNDGPMLVAPANGATDVTTSPTLSVQVSDPNGDPLTVTFYGKSTSAGSDFTIIGIPDTQYYTSSLNGGRPEMFTAQTQWTVANRDALNIAFVSHFGDVVEHGDTYESEWIHANAAMSLLDDPTLTNSPEGIPFGIAIGNHDSTPSGADGTTIYFNKYFGISRFDGRSYYGGHYGSNNDNHYVFFSAGGMNFIAIFIELGSKTAVHEWANNLLTTHSSLRAIVTTHNLTTTGNPATFNTKAAQIYNALKHHPNFFLMLGGHTGVGQRVDHYNGNTVYSLTADYQGQTNGGNGFMRIMQFSPANSTISVQTYSPYVNEFKTDVSNQFELDYDMTGFQYVGKTSVPSGSIASITWPRLSHSTTYEWYAAVSDGVETSQSPTWTFTTGGVSIASALAMNSIDSAIADESVTGLDTDETAALPEHFALVGNYPNPFNPTTKLVMDLPEEAEVDVEVYDVLGRSVLWLPAMILPAGTHQSVDLDGSTLASGVYFYHVRVRMAKQTTVATGKMVLMK